MEKGVSNYGLALFSYALEPNKVEEYKEEMKKWEEVFHENEEFLVVLDSAFLPKEERKQILKKTCLGMSEYILNFFYIIIDNGHISYLFDIIDAFITYCNEHQGIKEGIIFSTVHLDRNTITKIEEKLSKLENFKVYLRNLIDKSLIGGIKIVIGDHIYDGSLKNRLSEVKKHLLNKEVSSNED
ncbi:MAG: F0F1 ATP synthase subunit delta [Bacilli bacterium]|nr:F0F1 ATP synthase subunit delta [Bacilli bacterium]